jgi:hypothetical protein
MTNNDVQYNNSTILNPSPTQSFSLLITGSYDTTPQQSINRHQPNISQLSGSRTHQVIDIEPTSSPDGDTGGISIKVEIEELIDLDELVVHLDFPNCCCCLLGSSPLPKKFFGCSSFLLTPRKLSAACN